MDSGFLDDLSFEDVEKEFRNNNSNLLEKKPGEVIVVGIGVCGFDAQKSCNSECNYFKFCTRKPSEERGGIGDSLNHTSQIDKALINGEKAIKDVQSDAEIFDSKIDGFCLWLKNNGFTAKVIELYKSYFIEDERLLQITDVKLLKEYTADKVLNALPVTRRSFYRYYVDFYVNVSEYSKYNESDIDLKEAYIQWLVENGFLDKVIEKYRVYAMEDDKLFGICDEFLLSDYVKTAMNSEASFNRQNFYKYYLQFYRYIKSGKEIKFDELNNNPITYTSQKNDYVSFKEKNNISNDAYEKYKLIKVDTRILPYRVCRVCERAGIVCLGDLMSASMSELKRWNGFGPKCVKDVEELMCKIKAELLL